MTVHTQNDNITNHVQFIQEVTSVTEICNAVVKEGRIPEDWRKSWMVNVYKGKGDALECSSYRGIKLLEHVMKIMERVIEGRVRKIVKIDEMQFGFYAWKGNHRWRFGERTMRGYLMRSFRGTRMLL